jgi:nucleotide-binding universal stress UspA family protein
MRILVAIDGSDSANLAVDLVADVAWPGGTTIRVVEAIETGAALFGDPWPTLALVQADELEAQLRLGANVTVQEAQARLTRPGLTVESEVLRGRPAGALVDDARRMAADLIVVGSRGYGTIESMLLGSVSAEVIDRAMTPVLVARRQRIDRVVLAWDGSSSASRAAEVLRRWPIFARSSVRVVSVADIEVPWWSGFPEAGSPELSPLWLDAMDASRSHRDQLASAMTVELEAAGITAEVDRREGDAATEILAAANAFEADLILLGTHGRTGVVRLVLGSVARNVLHHASCSVLVVRETPAEADPRSDA